MGFEGGEWAPSALSPGVTQCLGDRGVDGKEDTDSPVVREAPRRMGARRTEGTKTVEAERYKVYIDFSHMVLCQDASN